MNILGISAFYHDSAAVILKDGEILCAAEEERFTRIKHDNQFPFKSVEFCLKHSGLSIGNIDRVAYYEKPLKKFERILENFIQTYPFSYEQFVKGIPEWLGNKIRVEKIIKKELGFSGKVLFVPHHLSHAAAAFFSSGHEQCAILTVDGVGEYQTTCLWTGNKNQITLLKSLDYPDSLGLLYSTFTAFLGFRVNEDEYKVMGLAAYGQPVLVNEIRNLIFVQSDGSFKLDMEYFGFHKGSRMWSKKFERLFGPPRLPDETVSDFHKNLSASVQRVVEDVYFLILNHLYSLTPQPNVAIAGGVALNALANGKIFSQTKFQQVHIFGPAGDSGAALGAAFLVQSRLEQGTVNKFAGSLLLGSAYENDQIEKILLKKNLAYKQFTSEDLLLENLAGLLQDGRVIGWFQGRMELGPRSLGSRSILAKPNPKSVKEKMNQIKRREQFRPFAGSILKEQAAEFFELPHYQEDFPYMNFCFQVRDDKREVLAGIVHADNSCRIQTVSAENGVYYRLLKKFYEISGIPCLLNTSFNLQGEPIVETPEQAVDDFLRSPMDNLAIGDFLISK
ncbi:MAG: carbamoyltransferase N-terminal domain-containing protein [Candidatus Doudnabacteria bacterium]